MRLLSLLTFSLFAVIGLAPAAQAKDKLTIYTYDSFVSGMWDPAPR